MLRLLPQPRASLCLARSWNTCVLESRRQHEWLRTALRNPHSRSRADAPTAHSAPPARPEPPHRPVALWLTHCPPGLRPSPLALLPASRETPPLCSTRYTRSLCIAPGYKARALQAPPFEKMDPFLLLTVSCLRRAERPWPSTRRLELPNPSWLSLIVTVK